jgi:hypothetical protein
MRLSSRSRSSLGLLGGVLLFAIFGALGCAHKIGDSCALSTDCSINGDRLCDTTQPGGYCTVFNCEPDKCPSGEGICVAFTDDACGAPGSASTARFQRTFCMKTCDNDGDCRDGYRCTGEDVQAALGARIVDTAPDSRSICLLAFTPPSPDAAPAEENGVCARGDASFPPASEGGTGGASPGDGSTVESEAPDASPEDAPADAPEDNDAPAD